MTTARVQCVGCGKWIEYDAAATGKIARCECGQQVVLPALDSDDDQPTTYDVVKPWTPQAAGGKTTRPRVAPPPSSVIRTQEDMLPRPQLAGDSAYPAPRSTPAQAAPAREPGQISGRSAAIASIVVVSLFAGFAVFLVARLPDEPPITAARPLVGDDEAVLYSISARDGTEINQWLQASPRHTVLGMSNDQAQGLAKALYDRGATRVLAFGSGLTTALAVELPDTPPDARAAVLAYTNAHAQKVGDKTQQDINQRYVILRLKP